MACRVAVALLMVPVRSIQNLWLLVYPRFSDAPFQPTWKVFHSGLLTVCFYLQPHFFFFFMSCCKTDRPCHLKLKVVRGFHRPQWACHILQVVKEDGEVMHAIVFYV